MSAPALGHDDTGSNQAVRTHDQGVKLLWLLRVDELVQFPRFQNEVGLHTRLQTLHCAELGPSLSSVWPLPYRLVLHLITNKTHSRSKYEWRSFKMEIMIG